MVLFVHERKTSALCWRVCNAPHKDHSIALHGKRSILTAQLFFHVLHFREGSGVQLHGFFVKVNVKSHTSKAHCAKTRGEETG